MFDTYIINMFTSHYGFVFSWRNAKSQAKTKIDSSSNEQEIIYYVVLHLLVYTIY